MRRREKSTTTARAPRSPMIGNAVTDRTPIPPAACASGRPVSCLMSSIQTGSPLASTRPGSPMPDSRWRSATNSSNRLSRPSGACQVAVQRSVPVLSTSHSAAASHSSASATPASTRAPALPDVLVSASARATALSSRELSSARSLIVATRTASSEAIATSPVLSRCSKDPKKSSLHPASRENATANAATAAVGRRPTPNAAMNGGTANRPIRSARSAATASSTNRATATPSARASQNALERRWVMRSSLSSTAC